MKPHPTDREIETSHPQRTGGTRTSPARLVQRFWLWLLHLLMAIAGKNDPDVLRDPRIPRSALHAEATVGLAIAVTSIFAAVASTASMLMVLDDHPWRWFMAPAFGLVWATAIFCIDRALVIAMDGTRHWGALLIRLFLSAVIAVSVSLPIDIAIFQDRVGTQLHAQQRAERLKAQEESRKLSGVDDALQDAERARAQLKLTRDAAQTWPPTIVQALDADAVCARELEGVRSRVARQIADLDGQGSKVRQQLASAQQQRGDAEATATQVTMLRAEIARLQGLRTAYAGEVAPVARRCEKASAETRVAQKRYLAEVERDSTAQREAVRHAEQIAMQARTRAFENDREAEEVAQRSLSSGFAAKAEALHRLVAEDPYVRTVYLAILIVWLTLEMAPVLARVMTGHTTIDAVLHAKARRLEIEVQTEYAQAESEMMQRAKTDAAVLAQTDEQVAQHPEWAAELVRAHMYARETMAGPVALQSHLDEFIAQVRQQRDEIADLPPAWQKDVGGALDALVRGTTSRVAEAVQAAPRGEQAAA